MRIIYLTRSRHVSEKKKLCLLVTGATRIPPERIIECIQEFKRAFEWANPDVWYFTWKTPNEAEKLIEPHVTRLFAPEVSPTQEDLDKLGVTQVQQLNAQPEHRVCRISHYAMVYGMDYLFKKIRESGQEYEFVCRIRNDLHFEVAPEARTSTWADLVVADPKAHVTPGILWAACDGASDHIGFGLFETLENIWKYEPGEFNRIISESWNFEQYVGTMTTRHAYVHRVVPVVRYVIRRSVPEQDWIIK